MSVPTNRESACTCDLSWTEEQKILLRIYIVDSNLGNCLMAFGFKNDEVGIRLNKRTELFMDDYVGFADGRTI